MNNNYHTHMKLCRHASGEVKDYVEEAIRLNFKSIGMSDHAPFEELKDRSVRMYQSDFPGYVQDCINAREKYKDQINVWIGLEIEYFEGYDYHYKNLLKDLDYLALGQHYIYHPRGRNGLLSSYALGTIEELSIYVMMAEEAMSTGYFKFFCHPDLFLYNVSLFTEDHELLSRKLVKAAIKYDIPLEINANGIRKGMIDTPDGKRYKYPRKEFWQVVKEEGARVIVSSDAHEPRLLYDEDVERCYEFAKTLGIKVEEELDMNNTVK